METVAEVHIRTARTLEDCDDIPHFQKLLDTTREMQSTVILLPQYGVQAYGLRMYASPQVSCVAKKVDDFFTINTVSRRHC